MRPRSDGGAAAGFRRSPFRVASACVAVCYLALATSFAVRPTVPLPGHRTFFDLVLEQVPSSVIAYTVASALLLAATVWPRGIVVAQTATVGMVCGYGFANGWLSAVNGTGWITASLCGALAVLHLFVIDQSQPPIADRR